MSQIMTRIQNSAFYNLYNSFSPASRAVFWFVVPFTLVDSIHYYTAGTALIISFPLLGLAYLLCGALAARFAHQAGQETGSGPKAGRDAGIRLWLTSTTINTLLAVILGFVSLGTTLLSGAVYLCLFAPLHALGSAVGGWLGGCLYQQIVRRINTP